MSKKHIHKYHRISLKFGQVWACALPTCSHHMPNDLTPTLLGKASICWSCGNEFILDDVNMVDAQPQCNACKYPSSLDDYLAKLGVK